ncbi:Hypothetical protein CINCED_3A024667 [Cinara cedri]|uniref:Uncharacterized protein n=1 Tax=Cinara cedri TaxID=506608 RepID=A0A5E4MAJ7_9HEMI|nr:Hypothetical protein CINCED_3A024667 [Cinara cedri]
MNLFNDRKVKEYIDLLNGHSFIKHVMTYCRCIENNFPKYAHTDSAPFSKNLAELAARQEPETIKLLVMYISNESYYNADTMTFLVSEMMNCENIDKVDQYYNVLYANFRKHPPCALYMAKDYEQLMLTRKQENATKYFRGMSLWEYLIECFYRITSGSILYGENGAFDLAFYRFFKFCVEILQTEYETAKHYGTRPLIMKCLNYNPKRPTRLTEIIKLLDMLFNTGFNFQLSVIQLAILVKEIKQI